MSEPLPPGFPPRPMAPMKPFGRFEDLLSADPYPLAAAALAMFRTPMISRDLITGWLSTLCVERSPTVLGVATANSPALKAAMLRIVLIWEHAMVAARISEGSDRVSHEVLLIEPSILTKPYNDQLAILRSGGIADLR